MHVRHTWRQNKAQSNTQHTKRVRWHVPLQGRDVTSSVRSSSGTHLIWRRQRENKTTTTYAAQASGCWCAFLRIDVTRVASSRCLFRLHDAAWITGVPVYWGHVCQRARLHALNASTSKKKKHEWAHVCTWIQHASKEGGKAIARVLVDGTSTDSLCKRVCEFLPKGGEASPL